MEISKSFQIPITHYVYEGLCNNIETKWITKNEWDKKTISDEMIVLKKDDPDWDKYTDCKFNPNSKCNCLSINYPNRQKYLNYVSNEYNITDKLLHTLYLSDKEQLRSFIKEYYNFDIKDLD